MAGDISRRNQESIRGMMGLKDSISGLFDDFFSGKPMSGGRHLQMDYGLGWSPAVDVRETEDAVVVHAALPGVEKEDIQLEVKDNTLVLAGKRKETPGTEEGWIRRELPTGQFYRAFSLSAEVRAHQVRAAFKDGILEIRLPKAEEAKPQKVPIS